MASKQNIVKSKLPYIDTFDHEVPAVVIATNGLTSEVFEHIGITSPMDEEQSIAYRQNILRGTALRRP